ncbi:hypothetical protein NDU88_006535 [Pleurodeles waltl]|uniref:Uncharacterized protein n=1 Tax=Pleurodeles waltl TaxID=8319 RepID=A0AAV7MDA1_PLEWA|nr:hypothetical protein NDU88_006535 [Pleurodeles waltl]
MHARAYSTFLSFLTNQLSRRLEQHFERIFARFPSAGLRISISAAPGFHTFPSETQAVAVSMSDITKNLEASFSKIMSTSKVPSSKGKKRTATLPVPSKGVSSGPSTREVFKSGFSLSPIHITQLRDTDDDDDDSPSHTDDMDGSIFVWAFGEKA